MSYQWSFKFEGKSQKGDFGSNTYAAQTFSDIPEKDGRRIQIAWMRRAIYLGMPFDQQMSFPCELTLRDVGGNLTMFRYPVSEIEASRVKTLYLRLLAAGKPKKLALTALMRKIIILANPLLKILTFPLLTKTVADPYFTHEL